MPDDRAPEPGHDDTVVVSRADVTVFKALAERRGDEQRIVLDVASDRDEPVEVSVIDHLPQDIDGDRISFTAECGDDWTVHEDVHCRFQRTLAPDESVTTVYGLSVPEGVQPQHLLTVPVIDAVNPLAEDARTAADRTDDEGGERRTRESRPVPDPDEESIEFSFAADDSVPSPERDLSDIDESELHFPFETRKTDLGEKGDAGRNDEAGTGDGPDADVDRDEVTDPAENADEESDGTGDDGVDDADQTGDE